MVRVKTREEETRANESIQNTKCESIISKQKNHLPKSIKEYVPLSKTKYNSFKDKISVKLNVKIDP